MMKYLLLFGTALTLFFATCKPATPEQAVTTTDRFIRLDKAQFSEKMATLNTPQIVDVRTPDEFGSGAMDEAVNINFYDSDFVQQANTQLDKNQPIMLYCAGGVRSAKAARILQKEGFKEVYDLKGGYGNW